MVSRNRQRGFLAKLAITGVSLLVTLGLLEASMRVLNVTPMADLRARILPPHHFASRVSANPLRQYELIPGAKRVGTDCEISINSRGLRDREHAVEKAPGEQRVLVIGDSVAFGLRVEAEQTFPSLLEQRCRERGLGVEVFNMGVVGYDTLQAVAFLEETGLEFDPDVVVLAYCVNDLGAVTVDPKALDTVQEPGTWWTGLRVAQWLRARMIQREWSEPQDDAQSFQENHEDRIVNLRRDGDLRKKMDTITAIIERFPRKTPPSLRWHTKAMRVGALRHSLDWLSKLSEEHDFEAIVMVVPILKEEPFVRAWQVAYDIVGSQAQEAGLGVLQLSGPVRRRGPSTVRLAENDNLHFNVEGHELVSTLLLEDLLERGLIGPK